MQSFTYIYMNPIFENHKIIVFICCNGEKSGGFW